MKILFSNKKLMKKVLISILVSFVLWTGVILFALFFVNNQLSTYFLKVFEAKTLSQLEIYHNSQSAYMKDYFQNIMNVAIHMTENPSIRNSLLSGNISQAKELIDQQRKINNYVELWSMFDKNGKVLFVSSNRVVDYGNMIGKNLSDREYFKQVINTKKPFISAILSGLVTKELIIDFSIPVMDNNNTIAYVLNGDTAINELKNNLQLKSNLTDYYNVILDRTGTILLDDGNSVKTKKNIAESDRLVSNLLSSEKEKIVDEEINYKGEKVFGMAEKITIGANPSNKFYLVSYFPRSQFDKQMFGLQAEVKRIFLGLEIVTLFITMIMWGLNYWLTAKYLKEREK